jgi:hypothetical protein
LFGNGTVWFHAEKTEKQRTQGITPLSGALLSLQLSGLCVKLFTKMYHYPLFRKTAALRHVFLTGNVFQKTLTMSYPAKLLLKPKLSETLFLLLAMLSDEQIHKETGFSLPSIAIYKTQLMQLLCQTSEVHMQQIYHAAKSCPELVAFLITQHGAKYKKLVPVVKEETHVTFKVSTESGTPQGYVWPC